MSELISRTDGDGVGQCADDGGAFGKGSAALMSHTDVPEAWDPQDIDRRCRVEWSEWNEERSQSPVLFGSAGRALLRARRVRQAAGLTTTDVSAHLHRQHLPPISSLSLRPVDRAMDVQAANLLATLKRPAASSSAKLDALNSLKSDIKHYRVPEAAQATIFECLKVCITQQASSTLASSAFSTLGHLIKRLKIQDASGHSIVQLAPRLFSALQDRMGDMREAMRVSASTALTELYPLLSSDVESIIRDEAIGGTNPRAKQTGLQWVAKMHKEEGMPFKAYTQAMVARLEDADGSVRETAKGVLIDLFANAPDRAKMDLKKQMKLFAVRVSTESQIQAAIGSSSQPSSTSRPPTGKTPEPEHDMAASTRSLPTLDHVAHFADTINSEAAQPPPQEIVQFDPLYVHSRHELEDTFRDMQPHFEGKETEQNWTPRDKSIMKLRRLTKGNAPSEYHRDFMPGIKGMAEGILKVANSLRTTMSTNGCQLVQELARTLGPALDSSVEMFLQAFVKMSASTKHIAAENGKNTVDAIFQHCSINSRTMQHIWYAAQEKNVQIRQCVPTWLKTVLKRQSSYKTHFESTGGLELAEKCIKKGLDDANPKVKEGTRGAYWTFAQNWPDKADSIMRNLDPKSKTALERDSSNPNASLHASTSTAALSGRTGAASRNALREMMAEQRKAKAAGKLPDRPVSAMAELSPRKQRPTPSTTSKSHLSAVSRPEARVASSASTASDRTPQAPPTGSRKGSALMSGPVRRPRRPELPRPQTADPYASKRAHLRPETPANDTPSNSPPKGTANSKGSVLSSSAARNRGKTGGATADSPGSSPVKRSPRPAMHSQNSRPTSKGSGVGEDLSSVREDDFTMVLPKDTAPTKPTHKRPGLGQTWSVDNGVVGLGEEDGFTMVMPNLPSQDNRARSPLAYRSPLKQMFDEARARADASISPKPDGRRGIDETMEDRAPTPRTGSPAKQGQAEEVQVYEDPFVPDEAETPVNGERKVLGELPVNENVRVQSPAQSNGSSQSPNGSPRQVSDSQPAVSTPQDRAELMRNRKLLTSGIGRIRSKTLDAHGFRRVQDIAKSPLDIWEGGKRYDELMSALLDYLQSFDKDPKLTQQTTQKSAGLKAQALGLTRGLMVVQKKWAGPWYPKILLAVLTCRKTIDNTSHLLADLERTADDVVRSAQPAEACIDAILDFLPANNAAHAPRSTAMALTLLRALRGTADLGAERKVRLVQTTAKYLDDADAEVRKADVELASELFGLFGSSKQEFWAEFKGTDEGRLGLLTYYIAKRGQAA